MVAEQGGRPVGGGANWTCMCQREHGVSEGNVLGKHGVLCETKLPGVDDLCYVRADSPDYHINDVRAIRYEKQLDPETPEAL